MKKCNNSLPGSIPILSTDFQQVGFEFLLSYTRSLPDKYEAVKDGNMMEILTYSIIRSLTVGSKAWAYAPCLFPADEEKHIELDHSTVDNTERVHSGFLHTIVDRKILVLNVPGIYRYFTTCAVVTQICPMSQDYGSNVIMCSMACSISSVHMVISMFQAMQRRIKLLSLAVLRT